MATKHGSLLSGRRAQSHITYVDIFLNNYDDVRKHIVLHLKLIEGV